MKHGYHHKEHKRHTGPTVAHGKHRHHKDSMAHESHHEANAEHDMHEGFSPSGEYDGNETYKGTNLENETCEHE